MPVAISTSDFFQLPSKRLRPRNSDISINLICENTNRLKENQLKNQCVERTNSLENMKIPQCKSLQDFLKKKVRAMKFRAFLQKEFSEENLDFWTEVEAYKKQKASKQCKLAQKIYETYIAVNAPREINIDQSIRIRTKSNLSHPDSDTFVTAQACIYSLMERDSFRRYLRNKWSLSQAKNTHSINTAKTTKFCNTELTKSNIAEKSSHSLSLFRSNITSTRRKRKIST